MGRRQVLVLVIGVRVLFPEPRLLLQRMPGRHGCDPFRRPPVPL